MELWKKQALFARNMADLIIFIDAQGYFVTMGECYRTKEQAQIDVDKGTGILASLHCKRLAVDINVFDKDGKMLTEKDQYEPFGRYWESLNPLYRWGGDFKRVDSGHFEMQDL